MSSLLARELTVELPFPYKRKVLRDDHQTTLYGDYTKHAVKDNTELLTQLQSFFITGLVVSVSFGKYRLWAELAKCSLEGIPIN